MCVCVWGGGVGWGELLVYLMMFAAQCTLLHAKWDVPLAQASTCINRFHVAMTIIFILSDHSRNIVKKTESDLLYQLITCVYLKNRNPT